MPLGFRILIITFASVLCGLLGRMGGSGNYPRQSRVVGIPAILCILAYIFGVHSWWLLLSFVLLCASVATYFDFLFHDVDNFWFHGFMIGLSLAPIALANDRLFYLIPAMALSCFWMGEWSEMCVWDVAEEFGRYAILPVVLLFVI
jgi:hypothetical protein